MNFPIMLRRYYGKIGAAFQKQIGMMQKTRQDVIEILKIRFGKVPKSFLDALEEIADLARLNRAHKESIKSASLEDFIRWFENTPGKPLVS